MTSRIMIGQYKPADSVMHRMDALAKILFAFALMVFAVMTASIAFYVASLALVILLLVLSRISAGDMARNFRPFVILIAITFLYHLIFSGRESEVLYSVWKLRLTEDGLRMAVTFSLRVLVFVGLAFLISLTTLPSDMADALVSWMKPFRKIGIPVNDIALIIFIAMRFIPVLAEEFDTIKKAQMVRGVEFSGNLIKRGRKMVALLIPVFQSAIRRADDLAVAIESRGYVSGAERTSYNKIIWRINDWIFLILGVGLVSWFYFRFGIK